MREIRFNDLIFDEHLLFAKRGDTKIQFTRQERAIIGVFTRNPRRLLNRAQILDAISHTGSTVSDRNVDFLVNRLRNKLGDKAREPRFIATQYGEGYIWIAEPGGTPLDALLVVGPCYGLAHAATAASAAAALSQLEHALSRIVDADQTIAFIPDWRRAAEDSTRFSLDISFHDNGRLHAAFALRHGTTGQVLRTFRETLAPERAHDVAERIKQAIWNELATPASDARPEAAPLELRMHDAALMLSGAPESWREIEAQVSAARAAAPDDPGLAIMQAMGLFARLLQNMPPVPAAEWSAVEDEIETLVLGSLPGLRDDPILKLGAAKLLFFIDRGHLDLADTLTREVFEQSTAFAASFAMQGQISMCRGDIAEAVALYDKAIELSEDGADFLVYLLVLKATALLAAGERKPLDEVCARLYEAKPLTRMQLGLFLADPCKDLPPDLAAGLSFIDGVRARRVADFLYRTSARHFLDPHHRANVMRGLLSRLVPAFGGDIVPAPLSGFDFTRIPA